MRIFTILYLSLLHLNFFSDEICPLDMKIFLSKSILQREERKKKNKKLNKEDRASHFLRATKYYLTRKV